MEIVPGLFFGLWAGVIADRVDRQKLIVVSDSLQGSTVMGLLLTEPQELLEILTVLSTMCILATFSAPAELAYTASIIDSSTRLRIVGPFQSLIVLSGLLGTLVGVSCFAWFDSPKPLFILDAFTFWLAAAAIHGIAPSRKVLEVSSSRVWRANLHAARKLLAESQYCTVLVVTAIATAGMTTISALHAPLALITLGLSPYWYGIVEVTLVVAAIVAGFLVSPVGRMFNVPTMASAALVLTITGSILCAVTTGATLLVIAQIPLGFGQNLLGAAAALTAQNVTPDSVRGLAAGMFATTSDMVSVVALCTTAVLVPSVGVRTVLLGAAFLMCILAVAASLRARSAAGARADS